MFWPVIAMVQFAVIIVLVVVHPGLAWNWTAIGAVATAEAAGVALWLGWREGAWRRSEKATKVWAAQLWLKLNLNKIQQARKALSADAFTLAFLSSGRPWAVRTLASSADCFEEFATNPMTHIADQEGAERLALAASRTRALLEEVNNQMSTKIATSGDVQREMEALFKSLPTLIGGNAL